MTKRKILYLGLDPKNFVTDGTIYHYPIIQIRPREIPPSILQSSASWTHILFTSRIAVALFFQKFSKEEIKDKILMAVGKKTAEDIGLTVEIVAKEESQEGVIEQLETLNLENAHFFFPHSSLSRPLIIDYFKAKNIKYTEAILYDTMANEIEIPPLSLFDEIVFTSPSTVDAFFSYFSYPVGKKITALGPITQKRLDKYL